MFRKDPRAAGQKIFEQCDLKEVTTTHRGGTIGYNAHAISRVVCPTTIDGTYVQAVESSNLTERTDKAVRNSRTQLAQICGSGICAQCVYRGAKTELDVENIRQERLSQRLTSALAREESARLRQIVVDAEIAAAVAENALAESQTPQIANS